MSDFIEYLMEETDCEDRWECNRDYRQKSDDQDARELDYARRYRETL